MPSDPIAAAGGVVWRVGGPSRSQLEIAVVHRPRYDDWSLPKGKLDHGEDELSAAVREVGEEIGASVAVQRRLKRISYLAAGEPKTVAYWVMRHGGGAFTPNDEVDELRWLTPAQARPLLSYDEDRSVVDDFAALPVPDSVVVLVRHAKAGKRSQWRGDDDLRPLEPAGEQQARALTSALRVFSPGRVLAATPLRCQQTVEPLARSLQLAVEVVQAFSDAEFLAAPIATSSALYSLAVPGQVTVVCSQGTTIPALVGHVAPTLRSTETRKADCWVLSFSDGAVIAADHYAAPKGG